MQSGASPALCIIAATAFVLSGAAAGGTAAPADSVNLDDLQNALNRAKAQKEAARLAARRKAAERAKALAARAAAEAQPPPEPEPPPPPRKTLPPLPFTLDAESVRIIENSDAFQQWPSKAFPSLSMTSRAWYKITSRRDYIDTSLRVSANAALDVMAETSVSRNPKYNFADANVLTTDSSVISMFGGLLPLGSFGGQAQIICEAGDAYLTQSIPHVDASARKTMSYVQVQSIQGSLFPLHPGSAIALSYTYVTEAYIVSGTSPSAASKSVVSERCVAGNPRPANSIDASFTGNAYPIHCSGSSNPLIFLDASLASHYDNAATSLESDYTYLEDFGTVTSQLGITGDQEPTSGGINQAVNYDLFKISR